MVEGARLESVYTATYRGFESLSLRHDITLSNCYLGFFILSVCHIYGSIYVSTLNFYVLVHSRISENQVMKIVSGVEGLRDGRVGPLFDALRSAVPMTSISSGDQPSD